MGLPIDRGRAWRLLAAASVAAILVSGWMPRAMAAAEPDPASPPLIAYASEQDAGGVYEIYTIAADGTGRTRLTNNTDVDTNPTWSPDGTRIAFESHRGRDIWIMNADGTDQTNLTQTPAAITANPAGTTGTFESQPAWSPDGTRIAYIAFGDGIATSTGSAALMVIDVDGTNRVQLTTDTPVGAPAWSPDGTRILLIRSNDIWSIDVAGGSLVQMTNSPDLAESQPDWSPVADRIVYTGHAFPHDLHLINPDGTNRVQLTSDPASETNPAWSADGTRIAFERWVGASQEIFVINADGSGTVRVTDYPGSDILPAWQPMAAPAPSFDWTMPDRYGDDGNGDGLIDTFPPDANGGLEIEPDGWRVDFDASPGAACDTSQERTWLLDGVEILPSDPAVIAMDADACTLSYEFPAEGTYPVGLEVRDADGLLASAGTKDVPVQDWLVVSIGDSVASGEGNPDIAIIPTWQDRQCHRSAIAGPARAAQALEAADPRTSVTFIHLACSGATTLEGLLGPYAGQEEGSLLPPQVDMLTELAGDREVDAVLVSIGANDVKFSQVVIQCLAQRDCTSNRRSSAASGFARDLALLPGNYDLLALALADRGVAPDRVYLSEYFDPTRDDTGAYCDKTMLADADFTAVLGSIGVTVRSTRFLAITAEEAAWASDTMMPVLNLAGTEAAVRNGWNRVGGIRNPFLTHGYCANDHWVVTFTESIARQENQDGSLHPNAAGHELYGQRLAAGLIDTLYAGGDLDQPRVPAAP